MFSSYFTVRQKEDRFKHTLPFMQHLLCCCTFYIFKIYRKCCKREKTGILTVYVLSFNLAAQKAANKTKQNK